VEGPVVHLAVTREADPAILAAVHRLEVTVTLDGGESETFSAPEAGSPAAPLAFPTDLAIVASGTEGTAFIEVLARDATRRPVGRGVTSVSLGEVLVRAQVTVGVTSTCGDGRPAPGDVPEVCLRRSGEDLILGAEDWRWGNIGNGVVFHDLDRDRTLDLVAVWAADWDEPEHESGLSLFLGERDPTEGTTTYDPGREDVLVDPDDPELSDELDNRRSNTEVTVMDLLGPKTPDPDHYNDLVVSSLAAEGLSVWPGDMAAGVYAPPVFIPIGHQTGEVHGGDVIPDLPGDEVVVGLRKAGELAVVGHAVVGEPPRPIEHASMPAGHGVRGFQIVDLDGDGDLDVVSAAKGAADTGTPGQVTVHDNDGSGSFSSRLVGAPQIGQRDVAALDLDGDGTVDLATVNEETAVVAIHRGLGGMDYELAVEVPLFLPGEERPAPERLRVGDVDGDGHPDLIASDSRFGSVFVLLLHSDGEPWFPPVRLLVGPQPGVAGEDVQGCAVADGDGDGVLDLLAVVDRKPNAVRVFDNDR